MAQDKPDLITSTYPLPAYNYRVTILTDEPLTLSFAEVSGLNLQYEAVTYKHGFSFVLGDKIIPGMRQPIRLTMKRGVVKNDDFLQSWMHHTYTDMAFAGAKRDILIDLCNETGESVITWKVQGALPIKLEAPTFNANSNEVAIETMEFIAHDLQIDYHP